MELFLLSKILHNMCRSIKVATWFLTLAPLSVTGNAQSNIADHPNNNSNVSNVSSESRSLNGVSPDGFKIHSHYKDDAFYVNSSYEKLGHLYRDLFKPTRYNPRFRPVYNQSKTLTLEMTLRLFSVISIDDVDQNMVCDFVIDLFWKDELITWDIHEYRDIFSLTPEINDIWTPNILVVNSLDKKGALGQSTDSPPKVYSNGKVIWGFELLMTTSCNLDLDKYPFDEQTCFIEFVNVQYTREEVDIVIAQDTIDTSFFTKNYGWELLETTANVNYFLAENENYPRVVFTLKLKRRPSFFVINDIFPTVALSLLNCFVFIVPLDSGEKISFGISVLLALAVFLSNTSTKLPHATDGTPALTKYLGILFANSIIAVIITIINFRLHRYVNDHSKENINNKPQPTPAASTNVQHEDNINKMEEKDPYYTNSSYITIPERMLMYTEMLGFILITGTWCAITAWFFIHVNS